MSDATKDTVMPNCARCAIPAKEKACRVDGGRAPADCPTLRHGKYNRNLFATMLEDERVFTVTALMQECMACDESGAPVKPRIVEIVEFAKRMHYRRIGLLFCGGAHREAGLVQKILDVNGFETVSVMCKAGGIRKAEYRPEGVKDPTGTACNPAFQSELINLAGVDLAILMNLCVGHDSLAIRHLTVPVTVFAVKDRVTGHSPLAPLYLMDTYYSYLKSPLPDPK